MLLPRPPIDCINSVIRRHLQNWDECCQMTSWSLKTSPCISFCTCKVIHEQYKLGLTLYRPEMKVSGSVMSPTAAPKPLIALNESH